MKKLIIQLILFTIGIITFGTVIHEAGHAVAALILGVPISAIKMGFYGINPSVTLPDRFASLNLAPMYYAGGFGAALALLIVYIFLVVRYLKKPTVPYWFFGFIAISMLGLELGTGYVEGRFHSLYIASANTPFSPIDIIIYISVALTWLIHFAICQLSKLVKTGTQETHDGRKTGDNGRARN